MRMSAQSKQLLLYNAARGMAQKRAEKSEIEYKRIMGKSATEKNNITMENILYNKNLCELKKQKLMIELSENFGMEIKVKLIHNCSDQIFDHLYKGEFFAELLSKGIIKKDEDLALLGKHYKSEIVNKIIHNTDKEVAKAMLAGSLKLNKEGKPTSPLGKILWVPRCIFSFTGFSIFKPRKDAGQLKCVYQYLEKQGHDAIEPGDSMKGTTTGL